MSDETTTPEEAAPQEVEVEVAAPRDERLEALLERFTHHLELYTLDQIDDEVRAWLRAAWKRQEQ